MDVVCIDSMVFVWAIKEQATTGQEHMIQKTKDFLNWLDENNKKILLPAPIITEVLSPVDDANDRDKFMDVIYRRFRIAPVDDIAAQIGGKIWSQTKNWKEFYIEGGQTLKNRFKYDLLIVGVAIANKSECLYTEDDKLRKLAEANGLRAIGIPAIQSIKQQMNLFEHLSGE